MAIFSFKSKAKKIEEKREEAAQPADSKPAQPYKHIPKHAAADSLGQAGRSESSQDVEKISMASQSRKQNSMFDSTLADASHAQDIALNMAHGMSTPSSLSRRNLTNEAFTTHASDYFSPAAMRKLQANDPSLGYAKVAIARHDQGLAHYSSDSGYESAGPSRVPSEQNLDDMPRQYPPKPNGALLPELRLSDDARSERSSKSTTKKTRFQVDTEPTVPVEQLPSRTIKLAALEGFKVNKKGKVLDEEGDVIGELAEGDLLDCVRQKVNANGEVVDDIGKVVGIVRLCTASPPSLTVMPPTGGQLNHTGERESSPTGAPRSPTLDSSAAPQEPPRRPVRSASERSLSELSKPYARPPMSSVPENNVPGEDFLPASPELFAYKGEIPAGPHQHMRRRSSSPPLLSPPTNVRRPNPRRVSSSGMSSRSLGKQPVGYGSRRGPLSSYDNSPNGSDDGTETSNSDDGKFPSISYKRPMSVRSAVTVSAKPRTYFTHAGRITVDPNAPITPLQTQALKTKPATETKAAAVPTPAKEEKKKSRLSLFGKK